MELETYFKNKKGTGVLATSSVKGKVNLAIYTKPHVQGQKKVSFIMKDRLSHRNLKSNPNAAYLFTEEGSATKGVRLYLKMKGEETDPEIILAARKRSKPAKKGEKLFLVHFTVTKARALVGEKVYELK